MSSRISNNGKRIAQNLSFRFFLILSDFTFLTPSYPFSVQSEDFQPEATVDIEFKPKLPVKYRYNFYLCLEIKYFDDVLKRKFSQPYYFHYYNDRNQYGFKNCKNEEKIALKGVINNRYLSKSNEQLFDY